jgi:phage terminase large subunit-like protein
MTRAEKAMAFAERHLVVPEGALTGQKINIQPWQESFFRAVLDNPVPTRVAILSMARKNAKTATVAILLLVFLVGPEARRNSRISSGALSREQASEVYNYAAKMATMSPTISEIVTCTPSTKRIRGIPMNTEYRALAAEGRTAHGGSPLVANLDEAGQVSGPYNAFFEAITTSQGAHKNPLEIWISTQARTDNDLFNRLIDDAAAAEVPSTVCHVYRAPENCDLFDREAWEAANPSLGAIKSLEEMELGAARAARMPDAENTFRWLHLNQRINAFRPFISRSVWGANSCEPLEEAFQKGDVYAGLDLSGPTSLTAYVEAAHYRGEWHLKAHFFMPEHTIVDRSKEDRTPYDIWARKGLIMLTPGKVVAFDFVAKFLAKRAAETAVKVIAFDRWRIQVLMSELDRIGAVLPLVEFGQGFRDMAPAVSALEEALLQERVRHGNNPVLTMCFANCVVTSDPAGNRKLDKMLSSGRIDGAVATVMAIGASVKDMPQTEGPSVYGSRGLLLL